MPRRQPPPDQPALLPTEPPPPLAGDLVAAWCAHYSQRREGRQPHPALLKRVAGVCKSVGSSCVCIEDWRSAWRAACLAGTAGKFDVVMLLSDDQPISLYPVKQSPGAMVRELAARRAAEQRGIGQ